MNEQVNENGPFHMHRWGKQTQRVEFLSSEYRVYEAYNNKSTFQLPFAKIESRNIRNNTSGKAIEVYKATGNSVVCLTNKFLRRKKRVET